MYRIIIDTFGFEKYLIELSLNNRITREVVPELRGSALGCMSAIDKNRLITFVKITVLVFMGKNSKCRRYN